MITTGVDVGMAEAARVLGVLREMPGGRHVAAILEEDTLAAQLAGRENSSSAHSSLDAHVEMILRAAAIKQGAAVPPLLQVLSCFPIVRQLSRQSQLGREGDPTIARREAMGAQRDVEPVVVELCQAGLIAMQRNEGGSGGSLWNVFGPSYFFFCRTDALFQPWDPAIDAKVLCERASRVRVLIAREMDSGLKWGARRLNSATTYAELRRWIVAPYRRILDDRYVLPYAYLTDEGRRLVEP
jgi:hypothetical protein